MISLLTDYGLEDGFVAACHGVVAGLAPAVRVLDVTHLVPPGDVRRGSAVLAQTLPHLPPRGVHVAVVDPGVGTPRRGLALRTGDGSVLIGPDNGLLVPAAAALGGLAEARELTNRALLREPVSATFHGRDVFAPVAARLAAGTAAFEDVGPALDAATLVRLPEPRRVLRDGSAEAEIVTVDRFGNTQTSLDAAAADALGLAAPARVRLRAHDGGPLLWELPYGRTFGDVRTGEAVAYLDSAGLLTLAVNGGSAAARLGLAPGDPLWLEPLPG